MLGAADPLRVRLLSAAKTIRPSVGGVVYWMSRDQRVQDNWALLHARHLALTTGVGLSVVFCLVPTFSEATIRHYGFMLRGLEECEAELRGLGVPFKVLQGDPVKTLPAFVTEHEACAIVTDYSPLRVGKLWKDGVCKALPQTPLFEVDAHNVVPVWVASDKQEVGARTIRKKINDRLPTWLTDIPKFEPLTDTAGETSSTNVAAVAAREKTSAVSAAVDELASAAASVPFDVAGAALALNKLEPVQMTRTLLAVTGAGKAVNKLAKDAAADTALREGARRIVAKWKAEAAPTPSAAQVRAAPSHTSQTLISACAALTDWAAVRAGLEVDMSVPEIDWCIPGPSAALKTVDAFIRTRLRLFADKRNDPNTIALSDLSPYLHFGQLSAQRMALLVKKSGGASAGIAAFLEESVVRRELADNYCHYQPNYDSLAGAAAWARESLQLHAKDKREYIYSLEEFEQARTHEDIWNAAQRQMVATGKMHGFMRMYWAKKILEWTASPQEALRIAIYLNDRYSIDGRDPNGYVGCGWAIMGVHDMGWAERAVFGKIRFMNYAGCKRKFDIGRYVAKWGGQGPVKFAGATSKQAQSSTTTAGVADNRPSSSKKLRRA